MNNKLARHKLDAAFSCLIGVYELTSYENNTEVMSNPRSSRSGRLVSSASITMRWSRVQIVAIS